MVASSRSEAAGSPCALGPLARRAMVRAVATEQGGQPEPPVPGAASSTRCGGSLRMARPRPVDQEHSRLRRPGGRRRAVRTAPWRPKALAAFGVFCLVASGTYFVNDALDADADRHHPTSVCARWPPGVVSAPLAVTVGVVLQGRRHRPGVVVGGWRPGPRHRHLRRRMSMSYSLRLKHEPVHRPGLCLGRIRGAGHRRRQSPPGSRCRTGSSSWRPSGRLLMVAGKRSAEHTELGRAAAPTGPLSSAYPGRLPALGAPAAAGGDR